jgi:dipeptidyl aminopeptidase/acylaminoacyl peptidase
MPDIKEVYEMVVKQSPPQPDALERQRKRQDAVKRNRRAGAIAAVVAIAAALALIFALTRPANDTGGPAVTGTGNGSPSPSFNTTPPIGAQVVGTDGKPRQQFAAMFTDQNGLRLSPTGLLVAFFAPGGSVAVATSNGLNPRTLVGTQGDHGDGHIGVSWDPGGSRIAYSWKGNVYVMNVDGSHRQRLTDAAPGTGDYRPEFSPDGSTLVYWSGSSTGDDGGEPDGEIYTIPATGGTPTRLTHDQVSDYEPTWSPAGDRIAYFHGGQLWIMNANGRHAHRVYAGDGGAWAPAWSPDGSKIAFLSYTGTNEPVGPVMDVEILTLDTRQATKTGVQVLTDLNGPQWVSNTALLINRYN